MTVAIIVGDMVERLRELADNSVDSCVCDPPYHLTSIVKRFSKAKPRAQMHDKHKGNIKAGQYARLSKGFMGQSWDGGDVAFQPETWAEVLRVLKPGGHLVAFSGTRTYHRMAVAIEDAGFEVRDMIAWHYASGFPKSHDISKAIDKAAGAEREVIGRYQPPNGSTWNLQNDVARSRIAGGSQGSRADSLDRTAPATEAAREWEGYGTALKPATEPICLARKPLSEKSIAANILRWGTGALNIDGCRIEAGEDHAANCARSNVTPVFERHTGEGGVSTSAHAQGRWPANLCHDGSDEVAAGFPESDSGGYPPAGGQRSHVNTYGKPNERGDPAFGASSGSAARFFYCAKASKLDRLGSDHPTVKPVALMRWLVRLVTPPEGLVLDPFAGSGSTGIAAWCEGFDAHLIELRPEAAADAQRRIDFIQGMGRLRALETARLDDDKRKTAGGHGLPLFS